MKIKILIYLAGSVLIFIIGCSQKSSSKEFDHGEYIKQKMLDDSLNRTDLYSR